MATNIQGQFTWGIGAPDEAQATSSGRAGSPTRATSRYRRQIADGIGRCHASRGELDAARRRLRRRAGRRGSPTRCKPVLDLWDGDSTRSRRSPRRTLETSRRTGNRWDEWASQAARRAGRTRCARRTREARRRCSRRRCAILVDGGARLLRAVAAPRPRARRSPSSAASAEAREHVDALPRDHRRRRGLARPGRDGRRSPTRSCSRAEGEPDAAEPRLRRARRSVLAPPPPGRRGGRRAAPVGPRAGAAGAARRGGRGIPRATARGGSGSTASRPTAGHCADPRGVRSEAGRSRPP